MGQLQQERFIEKEYTYTKDQVINALKENREKFKTDYDAALLVYKDMQTKKLKHALTYFKKHGKLETHAIYLNAPVDRLADYDKQIAFYEKAMEDRFLLNRVEFDNIFNDQWDWVANAKITNSTYSNAVMAGQYK